MTPLDYAECFGLPAFIGGLCYCIYRLLRGSA